jgi:pimeloyl-ACP methyl ester carboxylesterase
MSFVTTGDGTQIYYKDWGTGRPIVFSHGLPLSSDDWDAQLTHVLPRSRLSRQPVLVMHGDDDQIVPYADAGPLSAKLVQHGTLKTYHGYPHGMPTTNADVINADVLAFVQSIG